jgi:hypothetical protein
VRSRILVAQLFGILLLICISTNWSAPCQAYLSIPQPGRAGLIIQGTSHVEAADQSKSNSEPKPGTTKPRVTSHQYLSSIWGASSTQIWAVGNVDSKVLVKYWSGSSWSDVSAPSLGTASALLGVGGTAANDVWGVGAYNDGTSVKTLVEHWDGSSWQVVPSVDPVSGAQVNQLSSVFAVTKKDVWAVGVARQYINSAYVYSVILEHFDGSAWASVASPATGRSSFLDSIHGRSASDIWTVGQYLDNYWPLLMHSDGASWKTASIAAQPFILSGVYEISATDAWVVGGSSQTVTYHSNGTTWTPVASPNPSTTSAFFNAVAGSSSNDVWAAGGYDYSNHTLIAHWDGNQWKIVASPDPAPPGANALSALAVFSPNDVWAVGDGFASGGNPIILHWDGTRWKSIGTSEASPARTSCDASLEMKIIGDSPRNRQEHCPHAQR